MIEDAHLIDLHVGRRVRLRRKACGLSQQGLAAMIELTFQQVQKYERGTNRISASKLFQIAHALNVPVEFFFEGLSHGRQVRDGHGDPSALADELIASQGGLELAKAYLHIRQPRIRRGLVTLAEALADEPPALQPTRWPPSDGSAAKSRGVSGLRAFTVDASFPAPFSSRRDGLARMRAGRERTRRGRTTASRCATPQI